MAVSRRTLLFGAADKTGADNAESPPFAVRVMNRMAFGPRPGVDDIDYFNSLGGDHLSRLTAYVDEQLDPLAIADGEADTRLSDPAFTTLNKTLLQLWQDHHVNSNNDQPVDDVERAVFVRAVYSRRQLLEVLADFWHNHFNIYARDFYARSTWVSWDRDVIREHALGNFRQMLEATAKHPAMLYYLDNYTSEAGGPNENYARELLELHTLGAEAYFGTILPGDVPPHPDDPSIPAGYVDNDVYEVMKCLTGWRVNDSSSFGDTGEFMYYPPWHENTAKAVMSFGFQNIPADQPPEKDGLDVLDMIAAHPATARYVSTKLCRRLLADDPPSSIVDAATATFLANTGASDQLKQVVRTILLSMADPGFDALVPWGSKLKRPFEQVVSAMRAVNADFTIKPDDSESNSFWWRFDDAGQLPFNHRPPDGYPDKRDVWQGSTSLVHTWRTIDWLLDENATTGDPVLMPVLEITQNEFPDPSNYTPDSLADFWLTRVLRFTPGGSGTWLGTDTHDAVARFLAQSYSGASNPYPRNKVPIPPADLASESSPYYWHRRLRGMVGLILSSPNFIQR